ncbi:hypothetical protein Dimus_025265 [Dionaea muscipula]
MAVAAIDLLRVRYLGLGSSMAGSDHSRFSETDSFSDLASLRGDEVIEVAAADTGSAGEVIEDKLFVAVGRKVSESKSSLLWALQNSGGNKVCLLHVHQPSHTISVLGGKFPVSSVGEREVRAHRENERQEMNKILDEYLRICKKLGVQAEKLHIDMDSIEKGIVELITRNRIGKLVMGGAADGRYSRKMIEPKSKKANYVRQQAPGFCHIWFICKQRLIHTREGIKESSPKSDVRPSNSSSSEIVTRSEDNISKPKIYRGIDFEANGVMMVSTSTSNASTFSCSESLLDAGSSVDFDHSSIVSVSRSSTVSTNSVSAVSSPISPLSRTRQREAGFTFYSPPQNAENHPGPSDPSMLESSVHEKLYQQLVQAMEEAEISRRRVFEESIKRRKAEKDAVEALRRANASESLYMEEVRQRKEIGEELTKKTEELENVKNQRDMALEELEIIRDQKLLLETQVEKSDLFVSKLGEKIVSVVEFLQNHKEQ